MEMYEERSFLQFSFRLQALAASRQWLLLALTAGSAPVPGRGGRESQRPAQAGGRHATHSLDTSQHSLYPTSAPCL